MTQLINGTRYSYLKITSDYDEAFDSAVYRVLGTSAHAALDEEDDVSYTEESFTLDGISGTADRIEQQPNGEMWLIDHKVVGAFKVAKALGVVKVRENILDASGNQTYYASGAKKGQPKSKWVYVLDIKQADRKDWTLQLNYYRIMVEKTLGYKIAALMIHAVVRDGNTKAAKSYMVDKKDYYMEIDILPDETVLAYFNFKKKMLLDALAGHIIPPACSASECWDGRKCKDVNYCPMRQACIDMGGNPWIAADTDEDEEA